MLLEWGDLQGFCVIRDILEGMENYVKVLAANGFFCLKISAAEWRIVTGYVMCTMIFCLGKHGSYRLLNCFIFG